MRKLREWFYREKNNILLYIFIATSMLIVSPVNQFFTIYQRDLGYELMFIGIIASAASFFHMFGLFVAGILSDRKGRKKPLIFVLFGFIMYPFLLIYFTDLISLLFIQIFYSIIGAAFWSISIAYLYDTNPKSKGGKAYSRVLMAIFIINLISPMIGGLVIENLGYRWLFSLSCYIAIIPLVILFFLKDPKVKRQNLSVKGEVSDIIKKPRFIKLWLAMMVIAFSSAFISNFFPIYLKEIIGLDYTQVGLFFSAGTLILILAQPVIGWLADRLKSRVMVPAGMILLGLAQISIASVSNIVSLFIARSLAPIGLFTSRVKGASIIAKITPKEEHALAEAIFKSSSGVGWSIMNAVAPLMIAAFGYVGVFRALGAFSIIGGLVYILSYHKSEGEEKKEKHSDNFKPHHSFQFTETNLLEHFRHK